MYVFIYYFKTGFNLTGQAGLKLLTSGDLPASASQSAGITGVSQCAWPKTLIFKINKENSTHSPLSVDIVVILNGN